MTFAEILEPIFKHLCTYKLFNLNVYIKKLKYPFKVSVKMYWIKSKRICIYIQILLLKESIRTNI